MPTPVPNWLTLWGIADIDLGDKAMKLIWNSKVKDAAEGLAKTLEKALDGRCTSCGYSLSGFRTKINPDLCAPCERDKGKTSRIEAILDKTWEKNRLGF